MFKKKYFLDYLFLREYSFYLSLTRKDEYMVFYMYFFLLIIFLILSVLLISIIIFQDSTSNELSPTISDYSSQLFTENSKSNVLIYTVFILLILFFINSLVLCKNSNWTAFNLKI